MGGVQLRVTHFHLHREIGLAAYRSLYNLNSRRIDCNSRLKDIHNETLAVLDGL